MGKIKRTIKYKEAGIMVSIYKTLVKPHVEYCAVVLSISEWSDLGLLIIETRLFNGLLNKSKTSEQSVNIK